MQKSVETLKETIRCLWRDQDGAVVSIEVILVATLLVVGVLVGMTSIRDGIISELSDVAGATQDVNQSYAYYGVAFTGMVGSEATTNGSLFTDNLDLSDDAGDTSGVADNCVTIGVAAADEG